MIAGCHHNVTNLAYDCAYDVLYYWSHACPRPPQGTVIAGTGMSKSTPDVRHGHQRNRNKHVSIFFMGNARTYATDKSHQLKISVKYIAYVITWVRASSWTGYGQWDPDQASCHQRSITHSAGCHGNATGLGQMAYECWKEKTSSPVWWMETRQACQASRTGLIIIKQYIYSTNMSALSTIWVMI